MKIFVFGAGASKASQPEDTNPNQRSPLVDELFAGEYEEYARGVMVGNELAVCRGEAEKNGSVEAWLTARWEAAAQKSDQTKMAELSFFGRVGVYVRGVLQAVSNSHRSDSGYAQLLGKLRDRNEPFGLLSFNYDTLLDRAVQDVFGKPLGSIDDYLSFPLLKLHGSVNWLLWPQEERPFGAEAQFDAAARTRRVAYGLFNSKGLSMNGLRVVDPRHPDLDSLERLYRSFKEQYCYPLIFLPLTVKAYDRVAGFEENLVRRAGDLMGAASDIYLVGYRAADELIHTVLGFSPKSRLHVVDRADPQAREIQKAVLARQPQLTGGTLTPGFVKFVETY